MAEAHRRILVDRCVALRADVHRGRKPQLGDDMPGAGQRRRERAVVGRLRDSTGTYSMGFLLLIGMALIGAAGVMALPRKKEAA